MIGGEASLPDNVRKDRFSALARSQAAHGMLRACWQSARDPCEFVQHQLRVEVVLPNEPMDIHLRGSQPGRSRLVLDVRFGVALPTNELVAIRVLFHLISLFRSGQN